MTLTHEEVLYGLRNLATGDDEESRIADIEPWRLSEKVLDLIEDGECEEAYKQAIRESNIKVTDEEAVEWARWFEDSGPDTGPADKLAAEMLEMQVDLWATIARQPGSSMIDQVDWICVIDEGLAPGWYEQIAEHWPNKRGPFYIYPTDDPVMILVADTTMTEDQQYAAMHPENWKM